MSTSLYRRVRRFSIAGLLISTSPYTTLAVPIFAKQPTPANFTNSHTPSISVVLPPSVDNFGRCKLSCALTLPAQYDPGCIDQCIRLERSQPKPSLQGEEGVTSDSKETTSTIVGRTDSEQPNKWLSDHDYENVESCYLFCANRENMADHDNCMEECLVVVELPPFSRIATINVGKRAPVTTFNSTMPDPPDASTYENVWNNCRFACSSTEDQNPAEIEACAQTCMQRHAEYPAGFPSAPPKPTYPAGFIPDDTITPGSGGGGAAAGTFAGTWTPDGFIPIAGTEPTRHEIVPDGTLVAGTPPPKKRSDESILDVTNTPPTKTNFISTSDRGGKIPTTNENLNTIEQYHHKCSAICKPPNASICSTAYPTFSECVSACLLDSTHWASGCEVHGPVLPIDIVDTAHSPEIRPGFEVETETVSLTSDGEGDAVEHGSALATALATATVAR